MRPGRALLKWLCAFCGGLQAVLDGLGLALVALILVAVVLEVISRYVLNFPYVWTDPASANALAWLTLLGATSAVWQDKNFAVTFFRHRLRSASLRRGLEVLALLLTVYYGIVLASSGRLLMEVDANAVVSGLNVSQAVMYGVIPVAGAGMALLAAIRIVLLTTGPERRKAAL